VVAFSSPVNHAAGARTEPELVVEHTAARRMGRNVARVIERIDVAQLVGRTAVRVVVDTVVRERTAVWACCRIWAPPVQGWYWYVQPTGRMKE
jgi:hypothetical protein